jgi:hypothetical protein
MATLGSNIFRFEGLEQLTQRVRVVRVLGLERRHSDYFQNRNRLGELSRRVRKPVTFIERNGSPELVVPMDALLPTTFNVPGRALVLEPTEETFELSFTAGDPDMEPVRLRILNFLLQNPLHHDPRLWQPRAGGAFFYLAPELVRDGVGLYPGVRIRAVPLPHGGLGVAVDKTFRFMDTRPVSGRLSKDDFERHHRGRTHVYRYPTGWYEIHPIARSDLTAGQYPIPREGGKPPVNLIEWILDVADKPVAAELAELHPEGAVLVYLSATGSDRAAPAQLCYRAYDSKELEHTDLPRRTIVAADERLRWAMDFVERHLQSVKLGSVKLRVAKTPEVLKVHSCPVPDLRFGRDTILSVRGTPGAQHCSIQELGQRRMELLRDPAVGLAHAPAFAPQYILLPRTVADSFGPAFVADLKRAVGQFTQERYEPAVVVYNDATSRAFLQQAQAIMAAATEQCRDPGFALTMLHDYAHRQRRSEDALAAYAQQELSNQLQIFTGICHVNSARDFYQEVRSGSGPRRYEIRQDMRGKALGYLRNVALNHVILTNQHWPFQLASPLHADVVIGLDVKAHSCCLIGLGERGSRLYSEIQPSQHREKLKPRQVKTYLGGLLRKIAVDSSRPPRRIVLHRDGEVFADEIQGAQEAIAQLAREGKLATDAELTVLSIPKSSPAPIRLFYLPHQRDRAVSNPRVGNALIIGPDEAYVCTTGEPFRRKGTARPLHIVRACGSMSIVELAEDVFALSCLSWMRPEDCMRDPITVRLADRYLTESAGSYDQEDVLYEESEVDGTDSSDTGLATRLSGPRRG